MSNFCGGLKMSPTALTIVNGIITIPEATPIAANAVSVCGQLFDGAIFKGEKYNGHKMITYANAPSEIDVPYMIKAKCGLGLDPRYFITRGSMVGFQEHWLLQVNTTPVDATVTVTSSGKTIPPLAGTNIYFMDDGEDYAVTVQADGYEDKTENIAPASDNEILDVVLTPTP